MYARWSAIPLLFVAAFATAQETAPLVFERQPTDPKATKIVLVGGKPNYKQGEHEFHAGNYILSKLLTQTPGVATVLVENGWPTNPETFAGAKCIVFFHDGGDLHFALKGQKGEDRAGELAKLADAGVGLVHLHTIIDYPKDLGDRVLPALGGVWQKGVGQRSHWIGKFNKFPDHPVTRGVTPFEVDDGWLWKNKFVPDLKGVTPILRTLPAKVPDKTNPDVDGIVSWTYERPGGGRSFTFTGGHLHTSWGIPGFRQLVTNGILWSAGLDVPASGAPVVLDPSELTKHVVARPAKACHPIHPAHEVAMPENEGPILLKLAALPRNQIGPFLILGVDKDAGKDVIEAAWAQRLIAARKSQTAVPLEDVNWAREIITDPERRLRADAQSMNVETTCGTLRQLREKFQQSSSSCQPIDVEPVLADYQPSVPETSIDEIRAQAPVPQIPREMPAVPTLLKQAVGIPLDPWAFSLAKPEGNEG